MDLQGNLFLYKKNKNKFFKQNKNKFKLKLKRKTQYN